MKKNIFNITTLLLTITIMLGQDFFVKAIDFFMNFKESYIETTNMLMVILFVILFIILSLNEVIVIESGYEKKYRFTLFILLISTLSFGAFVTIISATIGILVYLSLKFIKQRDFKLNLTLQKVNQVLTPTIMMAIFFEKFGKIGEINFPNNFLLIFIAALINYLIYTFIVIINLKIESEIESIKNTFYKQYLWILKYDFYQALYALLFTNTAIIFIYNKKTMLPTMQNTLAIEDISYFVLWLLINIFILILILRDRFSAFKGFIDLNEKNIENMTEKMKEGILILDKNLNVKFFNPAIKEMLKEVVEIKKDVSFKSISKIDKDLEKGVLKDDFKKEIYIKDIDKYFEITATKKINRYDDITGVVVIIYDVTEHEQLLKELQDKEQQLIISEKMAVIGQITAGVAHEINNPLGSIKSNVDMEKMLVPNIKDQDIKEGLSSMNEVNEMAITRIMDIVKGLKNFARLDESVYKKASINEAIESTLMLVKNQFNNIKLVKKLGELPMIECYPQQLNQVFMNIIVNAIQAVDQNDGKISIFTSVKDEKIYVEVEDNGCGIKEEEIDKIFDAGFTTKGVGVGTGLGLSISYKIISKHKGNIKVDSKVNKGTKFTIILPINTKKDGANNE